jgi:hypothetical protein
MKEQKNKKEVKVNAKGGDNNDRLAKWRIHVEIFSL